MGIEGPPKILREAGRPLHISELMRELRAKGSKAAQDTVTSRLSRYRAKGYVKQVAKSTYILGERQPPLDILAATKLRANKDVTVDFLGNNSGTDHEGGQSTHIHEHEDESMTS
jgi:hypothetical protein